MKVLELFAGSRSIGKIAESRGHKVCSIDNKAFDNIDLVMDCENISIKDLPPFYTRHDGSGNALYYLFFSSYKSP